MTPKCELVATPAQGLAVELGGVVHKPSRSRG